MKNIICKAYFFGGGEGIGDRDWTIMVFFFSRSAGVNASLPLYNEFKAKKYNIMLTISFNINSAFPKLRYLTLSVEQRNYCKQSL